MIRTPLEALAVLLRLCPEVSGDIEAHLQAPVSSYARHLWRLTDAPASHLAKRARSILRDVLAERLGAQMPAAAALTALDEFDRRAVMQAGLHCQLLLDRAALDAFLLGWIAAVENSLSTLFIFTGATVTMETVGREGPGWLDAGGEKINLFGLGRHKLCRQSVCAAGPATLNRRALEVVGATAGNAHWLQVLRRHEGEVFETAADALAKMNAALVREWDRPTATRTIFIDDRLAALVVARHLEDEDGLVSKLLADPQRRHRLEAALLHASTGPFGRFLPGGTMHFWGIRDRRIHSLAVEKDRLVEPQRPRGLAVPLDRRRLREALLDGLLLPNLFLLFLVLAILPRVRVVGGPRQIGYMPLFQSAFRAALDANSSEERELAAELRVVESGWGAPIIDDPGPVGDLFAGMPAGQLLAGLRRRYGERTLSDATKNLLLIRENPRWRKLAQAAGAAPGTGP